MREARARVAINGQETWLSCAGYNLPLAFTGVQVDCPVTTGYTATAEANYWGLEKDARLRVWPEGSPLLPPGTFTYPLDQRLFASDTQMGNEPVFVSGGDSPWMSPVYYHYAVDFAGVEGMVDVLSAVDGYAIVAPDGTAPERFPSYWQEELAAEEPISDEPEMPPDIVQIIDEREWVYLYARLKTVTVKAGQRVSRGQKIGTLGREVTAGGSPTSTSP